MAVCAKRHGEILAVCDEELVGRKFEDGGLVLDLKESFYGREVKEEPELLEMLRNSANMNLVGEQAISAARECGLLCSIKRIKGVPYAIIIRV